jgi:hypothetical protein
MVSAASKTRQRKRAEPRRDYAPIVLILAEIRDHYMGDFASSLALLDVMAGLDPAIHVFGSAAGRG